MRELHQRTLHADPNPSPERKRGGHSTSHQVRDNEESARAMLANALEADLADQLEVLPPYAASAIKAFVPNSDDFDGPNHSMRRRMVAGWRAWLDTDAGMPRLVRALACADEPRLNRLIEDAGLVHIALLAAGLTPERRVRLLSGLGEAASARATTFLNDPPEPQPRRELVKARLHAVLSRAEADGPRTVPREIGLEAAASLIAGFPANQRGHVRQAWPPAVYNDVTRRRADAEPHWRLAEATWRKLIG